VNSGQATIDLVYGNDMELFSVSHIDGQPTQASREAFRINKQVNINVR
jgi:hypothetical protein